jgi:predicted nucleic acid-binding protein
VLLAAWRRGELHERAMTVLADEQRRFVMSQVVRLELLPKAVFERRKVELEFYRHIFDSAEKELPLTRELADAAQKLAERHGLAAVDALHLAAAIKLGAEEFITSELPGKPMFRLKEIKVTSLHSL